MFSIREDDLESAPSRDLLDFHLREMRAHSPPGSVFALDLVGLRSPDVTAWSAWRADDIAAIGALKDLGGGLGELKSMRTHPNFLRQGAAAALLEHVVGAAKRRGMIRISLETGSGPAFEPALALYRRRGFADGQRFGDYEQSEFNQFLHLQLAVDGVS